MYTGNQLRQMFLDFFESKGHKVLPSASLIPKDDPTLLLTVAGMVPFKPYFQRLVEPPFPRATTSQKCVRTPDLEVVGKTARHHTFFEMLGNFSFGDYFKEGAITWAWEFITDVLKVPVDQLWVTIYPEDDQARNLWQEKAGVKPERIFSDPSNFWAAGPTGPCGPCSEIYIDLGEARGCGSPDCAIGCDCDRYLEIWNLVFMQYNRDEAGNLTSLPKQNIDTGMGLERIAAVMQGVDTNFDTDLFTPIINEVANIGGCKYKDNPEDDLALKVIADHARAVCFMLGDGIRPDNEGRGYVLRRILRRAVRYARLLGITEPFLERIFRVIQRDYSGHYQELVENENYIINHLRLEEKNFQATLEQGTQILQEKVRELVKAGEKALSGPDAFYLYETYGFPVELTEEILQEQGLSLDMERFREAAEEHRNKAREQAQKAKIEGESIVLGNKGKELSITKFLGYDKLQADVKILGLFIDGIETEDAGEGEEVICFLSETPFYAESGGQVADTGLIRTARAEAQVLDVKKGVTGTFHHFLRITQGVLHKGETAEAIVDAGQRDATARHHSATHLLQAALRSALGAHIQQAGSLVDPERLRFDFTHFSQLSVQEINEIEQAVNKAVLANFAVETMETSLEEAKSLGATALFGEKYNEVVRVVRMGDYSKELCGGTHVRATGEIGLVKIISEGGIGAGLRRLEAVAGLQALAYINSLDEQFMELSQILKVQPQEIFRRVTALLGQIKEYEREIQQLNTKLARSESESLLEQVQDVDGVKVLAAQVQVGDMDALRQMTDLLKGKLKSGVLVLGTVSEGKVNWVTAVTPEGLNGLHAGKIIKEVAKITGGGGGGRADMAQAGGKEPDKLGNALAAVPSIVGRMLSK
ncbi:MAG: alanine--tRNA ligase [Desulfitobacteriaceae bacterium]|nr:alanine--tRNA ligase [Desulfitobacteriaceae bacterium]